MSHSKDDNSLSLCIDCTVRIDVRGDKDGQLFFLEMNPNCGIFYPSHAMGSADFILSFAEKLTPGSGHHAFLRNILEAAVLRHQARQVKVFVKYLPACHSYGLFAARDFRAGEVVEDLEEGPVHLVTAKHVEETWGEREKGWFQRYAYPLNKGVFAIWSKRPEEWRPLNHSCDPNTWLEGLNVVARRDITSGEEITIEYAT